MEKSGFFNAVISEEGIPDRAYLAEDYANYFNSFIGNGVFPNPSTNLQAISKSNMSIEIQKGKGWINGYIYQNTDKLILPIEPADGALSRVDRITLRLDFEERKIKATVKQGKFASSPVAPELQRDADAYELGIADIRVNKGVISITQANITDLRLNNSLCGIVHGVVDQVDTTAIFNQFESWYTQTKANYDADIATWTQEKKDEFNNWYATNVEEFTTRFNNWFDTNTLNWDSEFTVWFDSIKGQLEGDIAANLAGQVTDLRNNKADKTALAETNDNLTLVEEDLDTHKADETTHGIGDKSTLKTTHKISIVGAVNELFLSASSGKTDIASVVGSPASSNNTFAQLKTHIQNAKNKGATNLSAKGTSANGSDTLDLIMTKIASVNTGKKWATGTGMSDSSYKSYTYFDGSGSNQYYPLNVVGLDFKPSYIICFGTGGYEPAFTIYMYDNPVYNTNDSIILGSFRGRMTTTQVINIKLGSGDSSIYLGGFSIPVKYNNVNCRWVAFE